MEAAIASLQAGEEQEFLRDSGTALKVLQNILNEPGEDKYRRVRSASKVRHEEVARALACWLNASVQTVAAALASAQGATLLAGGACTSIVRKLIT